MGPRVHRGRRVRVVERGPHAKLITSRRSNSWGDRASSSSTPERSDRPRVAAPRGSPRRCACPAEGGSHRVVQRRWVRGGWPAGAPAAAGHRREGAQAHRRHARRPDAGKEAKIARLASTGSTNPEIAAQLDLSPRPSSTTCTGAEEAGHRLAPRAGERAGRLEVGAHPRRRNARLVSVLGEPAPRRPGHPTEATDAVAEHASFQASARSRSMTEQSTDTTDGARAAT